METVEILHYKWCIAEEGIVNQTDVWIHANASIEGVECTITLVYCRVERVYQYETMGSGHVLNKSPTIRTVPVKRDEMETI